MELGLSRLTLRLVTEVSKSDKAREREREICAYVMIELIIPASEGDRLCPE